MKTVFLRRVGAFYETRPGDVKTLSRALDGHPATSFPADEIERIAERLEQHGIHVELTEGIGPSPLPSARELDRRIDAMAVRYPDGRSAH